MLSQATEEITAKLQGMIGQLLQNREIIQKLMKDSTLNVRVDAEGLIAQQDYLENWMNEIMTNINNIKSGNWSASDLLAVTPFFYSIYNHNKDVDSLKQKASGVEEGAKFKILPAALIGIGVIYFLMKRR